MSEMGPMWLTVQLAGVTTAVLLVLGTPLAWWLARTRATDSAGFLPAHTAES